MCSDHAGEVRARCFEVVVVPMDTQVAKLVDLMGGQDAEGAGDVDVDRRGNGGNAVADLRHQPVVGTPNGSDDAELSGTGRGGLLCSLTNIGMSSHADRTGESKTPDCEQK